MTHHITIVPSGQQITARSGENLLECLRRAGFAPNAPCGGNGTCGKCRVLVDGQPALACHTLIAGDIAVTVPTDTGISSFAEPSTTRVSCERPALAFDIGTTTVAGFLLDASSGAVLAQSSCRNPQHPYGADVITRIRHALYGKMEELTALIRRCIAELTASLCSTAGIAPDRIRTVSMVANPAMQQIFLGIPPENLARVPFAPVLTASQTSPAGDVLPLCPHATLLIIPNISGFIGADTVGCILATAVHHAEAPTLLVDIGTNGEMVLRGNGRMVACSTAAGPALEGANIQWGMTAQEGAIDHVWLKDGHFCYSVIGESAPRGICGSGLIDAVAAALDSGLLNERGKILTDDRCIYLTDRICLTQDDIRQVQLAKGAIAAGIHEMAACLGLELTQISTVLLAGAFGSFMDPHAACRIGLLPPVLAHKIRSVGNAAGRGAQILATDPTGSAQADTLIQNTEFLELAAVPSFPRSFARQIRLPNSVEYWIGRALAMGFTHAAAMDPATARPRSDVRAMCSADRCRAYGKNWTCPPHCGTLEECASQLQGFNRGILLQTVGTLSKTIDTAACRRTEAQHLQVFHRFADAIRSRYPDALCLGSGGCRICANCAWPEQCRFPEKACSSMEGYGLFVTQVCRDNGCAYHHGEGTITYTACVFFREKNTDFP